VNKKNTSFKEITNKVRFSNMRVILSPFLVQKQKYAELHQFSEEALISICLQKYPECFTALSESDIEKGRGFLKSLMEKRGIEEEEAQLIFQKEVVFLLKKTSTTDFELFTGSAQVSPGCIFQFIVLRLPSFAVQSGQSESTDTHSEHKDTHSESKDTDSKSKQEERDRAVFSRVDPEMIKNPWSGSKQQVSIFNYEEMYIHNNSSVIDAAIAEWKERGFICITLPASYMDKLTQLFTLCKDFFGKSQEAKDSCKTGVEKYIGYSSRFDLCKEVLLPL
jgi:hypothetical protein